MKITPTIIIDTREQCPLDFPTLTATVGTLDTGDYSIVGLTNLVAVERKSIDDLLACIGRERERFKRELQRLRGYRFRLLVVGASAADLEAGQWRSNLQPAHVVGSLAAWTAQYGLPVWLAGDHAKAEGAGMSETSLAIMGKVEQMLAKATTIQEVKEVKDLALTAADFARRKGLGEATVRKAQGYALRAEIKLGELLAVTERAKGTDKGGRQSLDGNRALPSNPPPTLADLGLTKRESSQAQGAHARIPVAVSVPAA